MYLTVDNGWDAGPSDILGDVQRAIDTIRKQTGHITKSGNTIAITRKNYNSLSERERQGIEELFEHIELVD